jgi:hypothetical protein
LGGDISKNLKSFIPTGKYGKEKGSDFLLISNAGKL